MKNKVSKMPIMTILLILVNIIFFIIEIVKYGNRGFILIHWDEVFDNVLVVHGQWWRMFTSIFMHFSGRHLAGELVSLAVIGYFVESTFGKKKFLLSYLISGVAGNLSALILSFIKESYDSLCGSTVAITGLVIAYVIMVTGRSEKKWVDLSIVLLFEVVMLVVCNGAGMDIQAMMGGIMAGVVLGVVFRYKEA